MQHLIAVSDIQSRAKAINLTLNKLAPSTAYRIHKRGDGRNSSVFKLMIALEAKEQEMLDRLTRTEEAA
jgi:hypothetical protein